MDIVEALAFFEASKQPATLATLLPDGRPHLSVIFPAVVDGRIWISSTQTRVKTRNIRNDPRVSISVGVRPWVAVEGVARIHDGDDLADRLRRYYRVAAGEHPAWDDYDRAMIAEQRLIIEIEPARAYA